MDDNENNLFTLGELLTPLKSLRYLQALDAKTALDMLLIYHVDLILCDVQMPQMNGFELCKLIKSNKRTKHIPVVFLTAIAKGEAFEKEGFELGAIDYITKPIDDNQLLNKITLYLEIFKKNLQLIESEKRFHDIAQNITTGVYTLDKNHKVTFINQEALRLLGYAQEELMGKAIHKFIHYKNVHNETIVMEQCALSMSVDFGKSYKNSDEHFIQKNGSFLNVSVSMLPLYFDDTLSGSVVIFTDNGAKNSIQTLQEHYTNNQTEVLNSYMNLLALKDKQSVLHSKKVASYCELIAKELDYNNEALAILQKAALLHDIGNIAIPESILSCDEKLYNDQFKTIQTHVNAGCEALQNIQEYQELLQIIAQHHEKYDGSGYPNALSGDHILPLSRILIVADAFDAMTTQKNYQAKKSVQEALEELENLSMIYYHPEVVSAAITALKDLKL